MHSPAENVKHNKKLTNRDSNVMSDFSMTSLTIDRPGLSSQPPAVDPQLTQSIQSTKLSDLHLKPRFRLRFE